MNVIGTVQRVCKNPVKDASHQPIQINCNQNKTLNLYSFPNTEIIPKPIPRNKSYQTVSRSYKRQLIYFSLQCKIVLDNPMTNISIWAAYNSLISIVVAITIISPLPLYSAPSAITGIYHFIKTVISLDLQLYDKALQLQSRNEIACNFAFRPQETCISYFLFNTLHPAGNYIFKVNNGNSRTWCEQHCVFIVTLSIFHTLR